MISLDHKEEVAAAQVADGMKRLTKEQEDIKKLLHMSDAELQKEADLRKHYMEAEIRRLKHATYQLSGREKLVFEAFSMHQLGESAVHSLLNFKVNEILRTRNKL
jgi:hypothetical protein